QRGGGHQVLGVDLRGDVPADEAEGQVVVPLGLQDGQAVAAHGGGRRLPPGQLGRRPLEGVLDADLQGADVPGGDGPDADVALLAVARIGVGGDAVALDEVDLE